MPARAVLENGARLPGRHHRFNRPLDFLRRRRRIVSIKGGSLNRRQIKGRLCAGVCTAPPLRPAPRFLPARARLLTRYSANSGNSEFHRSQSVRFSFDHNVFNFDIARPLHTEAEVGRGILAVFKIGPVQLKHHFLKFRPG